MNKWTSYVILSILISFVLPIPLIADSLEGKIISEIKIVGNERLSENYILQYITTTKKGKPFKLADVQKDLNNLKLTGKFLDVFATTEKDNGKVKVIFHILEKPIVVSVEFIGAKHIKTEELKKVIGIREGDLLSKTKAERGVQLILEKYKQLGFTNAEVELDEQALEEGNVIYRILEGPRVRIAKILFEGNKSFSAQRLRGIIKTKRHIWLIRSGTYNEEQIMDDIFAIRNFYRNEGFLDAKVGRRLDYIPDKSKLILTFVIDEGMQYTISNIEIEGNEHFSDEEILEQMNLQPGGIFRLNWLKADEENIRQFYGKNGFIEAYVRIKYFYGEEAGTVNLLVQIKEGKSYKLGRIIIRGNKKTQDRVIRRVLEFYPGDKFDTTKVNQYKRRLYETRLFDDIETKPLPGEQPNEKDLLIKVKEANTTRFILGIGVTSDSGVIGNVSLESWNFDLFDWPRSWGEFFRGQAFKGAGQTFRLSIEPGTEITRFRVYFREPYLFDRPISLSFSGYLFDRYRDDYNERRAGMLVSLGKRLKNFFNFIGSFRLEGIRIYDIDDEWKTIRPEELYDVEGWNLLTSLKLALVRDTTDSFFMPTKGSRLEVAWEQVGLFGGDFDYPKITSQFTYYKTLRTDVFNRKTVWASNVFLGYMDDAPIFERFYAGGIGSIRGFEFRGISPRKYNDELKTGGKFMLLVGNELSFPIVGKNLRGVTFIDMGTVEDDVSINSWRASVGFGLRLVIDYFGPIPMAFDFAWPISKDDADETQVFSFSLGATFR